MAIGWPEAIGAAPARRPKRSGGWQPGDFVVSRGMPAQPAGEESRSAPLRHRRSRRSRPSARSAHRRGRLECSIRQRCIEENVAAPSPSPLDRHVQHGIPYPRPADERGRSPRPRRRDVPGIHYCGVERAASPIGLRSWPGFDVGCSSLVERRSMASSRQQTTRAAYASLARPPLRCGALKPALCRPVPKARSQPTSSRERRR